MTQHGLPKVLFEPIWKTHAFGHQFRAYPPPGFEIIVKSQQQESVINAASGFGAARAVLRASDIFVPTGLVKSMLERWNRPPDGTALTYAGDHLIFRREPWVIEVEYASLVLGMVPKHLARFHRTMERSLASPYCRRILAWSEAGRRSLIHDLHPDEFADKITVMPLCVPERRFEKEYDPKTIRILFVGSGTSKGGFDYRGGREAVETFAQLRRRFDNIELVVRSDVPPDIRDRFGGLSGLTILDDFVSRGELDQLFRSADIFMLPSHNTSPMIMLDAMSYELPIVTIGAWANPEFVHDGETGMVVPVSKTLPYYYRDTAQPNWAAPEFVRAIGTTDPVVINDLAGAVGRLIDDPELRRRLGRQGRHEIESGRFSLTRMNARLAEIFDAAIDQPGTNADRRNRSPGD